MDETLKKFTISFMIIVCILLIPACSNTGENNHQPTDEQVTATDSQQATKNQNLENAADEEENIPRSEFHISKEENKQKTELNISEMIAETTLFITSMDIDSSIEKEVMETLTEFNAVSTEDGAKLTLPEDILFDFDSHELRSEAETVIDQLVQVIETTEDE